MRAYTWKYGKTSPGIYVVDDARFGHIVSLGKFDYRRRCHARVALDLSNPPKIQRNKVFSAWPFELADALPNKAERKLYILKRPASHSNTVLVRILTQWKRGSKGEWCTAEGSPQDLIKGFGAIRHPDFWADGLVTMAAGDVIRIYPQGDSEVGQWALWLDKNGVPATSPWSEFSTV